jgi:hypothetical protein
MLFDFAKLFMTYLAAISENKKGLPRFSRSALWFINDQDNNPTS